jgi:tetratricopeptide (TPR) repeat protein
MRVVPILIIVLAFGAVRLPIEHKLHVQDRQLHFHGAELDLSLREQIGQLGFAAALSGFRSIVADILFIQAHVAWERTEWSRVRLLFMQATTLQPRSVLFWDMAAWHMAWNASVAAMNDRDEPRLSRRLKKQQEYFAIGKDFLERGIRHNPDKPQLYEALARLYQQKFNNHERAAALYAKAAALPGAPSYDKRFAAYELSYCEGREREAYAKLRQLYDMGEKERLPTLLRRLKFLEDKIDIAQDRRIPEAAP